MCALCAYSTTRNLELTCTGYRSCVAKPIQDSPGTLQYCNLALLARIEVAVLMWLKCVAKGDALAHGVSDSDIYKTPPVCQTDS